MEKVAKDMSKAGRRVEMQPKTEHATGTADKLSSLPKPTCKAVAKTGREFTDFIDAVK
jgi:hypothetical protein